MIHNEVGLTKKQLNKQEYLRNLRSFLLQKTYSYGYSEVNWHFRSLLNWHRYEQIVDDVSRQSFQGLILDDGCGFGQISEMLQLKGKRVIGLDIGGGIHECKVWKHLLTPFILGDGLELPFASEMFDVVVCCGAMEHTGNERKFLEESNRILKNNGLFLCYYLPNKTGFESLFRKIVYTDHIFYDGNHIKHLFKECGYEVLAMSREHVIPILRISSAQEVYNRLNKLLVLLDDVLNKTQLRFFGDNWRIYGRKIKNVC